MFQIIVTSQDKTSDLIKLFTSLSTQNFKIQVIFVNQTGIELSEFYRPPCSRRLFSILEIKSVKCGLSEARNKAFTHIASNCLVAFADDDCWYSAGLTDAISNAFKGDDLDCLCVNVFDPERNKYLGNRPTDRRRVGLSNIFSLPISVGIFVKSDFILQHGIMFDEEYGIGASYGSGEETEFLYRMVIAGARIRYFGDLLVYHPAIDSHEKIDLLKTKNYATGFGRLNKRFLLDGNFSHLPYFIVHFLKSVLGVVIRPRSTKVYLARLSGILDGLRS